MDIVKFFLKACLQCEFGEMLTMSLKQSIPLFLFLCFCNHDITDF